MELLDDLAAEHDALDAVVAALPEPEWDRPSAAPGWAVRHQLSHLTYFDEQGALAARDPAAFEAGRDALLAEAADDPAKLDTVGPYGDEPAASLLAHWRTARTALLDAFVDVDPKARLPWYGPPMSARSFLTARLMETWAHGVDITDAFEQPPSASDRLRHIAHLGFVTRGWSYAVRGAPAPDDDVALVLTSPSGESWTWGESTSPSPSPSPSMSTVEGPALDFCLVVTQRRPLASTGLRVEGDAAVEWLSIAQAFAGGATATTRIGP